MSKSYIELINRFWTADDTVGGISQYSAKLYFYILRSCNEHFWKLPVSHSDRFLADKLGMSVNTLRKSKQELTEYGLLTYKVPEKQSKNIMGQTRFYIPTVSPHDTVGVKKRGSTVSLDDTVEDVTVSPDDTVQDLEENEPYHHVTQTVSPHDTVEVPTVSPGDTKNKTILKTEDITTIPNGIVVPKAKKSSKKKKEKSSAGAVVKISTPHWEKCVETWFGFYEGHFGEKPTFSGSAPRDLQTILNGLQKKAEERNYEWTEQQAVSSLTVFLQCAMKADRWLKENFLLLNLNRQFDKIIQHAKSSRAKGSVGAGLSYISEIYNDAGQ